MMSIRMSSDDDDIGIGIGIGIAPCLYPDLIDNKFNKFILDAMIIFYIIYLFYWYQ